MAARPRACCRFAAARPQGGAARVARGRPGNVWQLLDVTTSLWRDHIIMFTRDAPRIIVNIGLVSRIAPSTRFCERNSLSRKVHILPVRPSITKRFNPSNKTKSSSTLHLGAIQLFHFVRQLSPKRTIANKILIYQESDTYGNGSIIQQPYARYALSEPKSVIFLVGKRYGKLYIIWKNFFWLRDHNLNWFHRVFLDEVMTQRRCEM